MDDQSVPHACSGMRMYVRFVYAIIGAEVALLTFCS